MKILAFDKKLSLPGAVAVTVGAVIGVGIRRAWLYPAAVLSALFLAAFGVLALIRMCLQSVWPRGTFAVGHG